MSFDLLLQTVEGLDYNRNLIKDSYDFTQYKTDGKNLVARYAAFYREPYSVDTCCIGFFDSFGERVPESVKFLGAPRIICFFEDKYFLHEIGREGKYLSRNFDDIVKVQDYLEDNRERWSLDALIRLKNVSIKNSDYQADLFDYGLPLEIDKIIEKKLGELITAVISKNHLQIEVSQSEILIKLLFNFIVAKYIMDYNDKTTPSHFIDTLQYFPTESAGAILSAKQNPLLAQGLWAELKKGFSFKNISPKHLSHIYENTLIEDELRKHLSVHATPYRLANIIVNSLPDHLFNRKGLQVFEPFCGYAPFLMACANRINNSQFSSKSSVDSPDSYKIVGCEIDGFSIELAKYGLFLENYPYERRFIFNQMDAFVDPLFIQLCQSSDFIFCNPPYESIRRGDATKGSKATWAIQKIIESSPRAVGFVVPRSFTSGKNNKDVLDQISKRYNNIEITILPDNVFNYSDISPALIIAWRDDVQVGITITRREVYKSDYESFIETGIPSSSSVSRYESTDVYPYWTDPLKEKIKSETLQLNKLSEISRSSRGLKWKAGTKASADGPLAGYAKGILNVQGGWEYYIGNFQDYLNIKLEDLYYASLLVDRAWSEEKILVNAHTLSRSFRRVKAVVDKEQHYAGQSFHVFWPLSGYTTEFISAVINSPLSNVFLTLDGSKTDINLYALRDLPVPNVEESVRLDIGNAVSRCAAILRTPVSELNITQIQSLKRLMHFIDSTIFASYGLSDSLYEEILEIYISNSRDILQESDMEEIHRSFTSKYYKRILTVEEIRISNYIEWLRYSRKKNTGLRESIRNYSLANRIVESVKA